MKESAGEWLMLLQKLQDILSQRNLVLNLLLYITPQSKQRKSIFKNFYLAK